MASLRKSEVTVPVRVKRVYEKTEKSDGLRALVDRLWPRGISKEKAGIERWLRELSPSTELRRWYGHDPARWEEFKARYFAELDRQGEAIAELVDRARAGTVTLLYGSREKRLNNAVALKEYLERRLAG
jgi:uncharacterized protein YeaO (DUF488 family)